MTEAKKRLRYIHVGACGDCPPGQEYQPRLNPGFFKDVYSIYRAALTLINRHQIAQHPKGQGIIKGIL